jgi:hypothetical protein
VEAQVIELPYGLNVQSQLFGCSGPPMTRTYTAVNPASAFVLRSNRGAGSDIDDDDLVVARLLNGTQVQVEFGPPGASCAGADYNIQLVELTGATVTRGTVDAGMAAGNPDGGLPAGVISVTAMGLPPVGPNTILLVQPRADDSPRFCTEFVRGDMPSPTSITFTRGSGDAVNCVSNPVFELDWQRIDFGARATVQTRQVTMLPTETARSVMITTVDMSRAFALMSGMPNGNGGGETDYFGSYFGSEAMVRVQLSSSTTVQLSRQRANGTAMFTLYVVELEP